MTSMSCAGVTPFLGVCMTSTEVVYGIATLGTPESPPAGVCERSNGKHCMRNGMITFIGYPFGSVWFVPPASPNSVRPYSIAREFLLPNEGLDKELPRLRQQPLPLFWRRNHPRPRQHPCHARKQNAELCQFFFSCLARDEWHKPTAIGV